MPSDDEEPAATIGEISEPPPWRTPKSTPVALRPLSAECNTTVCKPTASTTGALATESPLSSGSVINGVGTSTIFGLYNNTSFGAITTSDALQPPGKSDALQSPLSYLFSLKTWHVCGLARDRGDDLLRRNRHPADGTELV